MRWAAIGAVLVGLACAAAALALVDGGHEDAPPPVLTAATRPDAPEVVGAASDSRADAAAEELDPGVCRRRDLGQWDREAEPRDFAPRCVSRPDRPG